MKRVRRSPAALWIGVTFLLALACEADPAPARESSAEIRGQRVGLEVVRTRDAQARGLGYRDSLEWGRGMLFIYDEADFYGFWMKGMRFDIDIVWIRAGRIVEIAHRVKRSPEGPGPTYRPREVADQVLEVSAGFAEAHGWRRNDVVTLDLASAPSNPAPR